MEAVTSVTPTPSLARGVESGPTGREIFNERGKTFEEELQEVERTLEYGRDEGDKPGRSSAVLPVADGNSVETLKQAMRTREGETSKAAPGDDAGAVGRVLEMVNVLLGGGQSVLGNNSSTAHTASTESEERNHAVGLVGDLLGGLGGTEGSGRESTEVASAVGGVLPVEPGAELGNQPGANLNANLETNTSEKLGGPLGESVGGDGDGVVEGAVETLSDRAPRETVRTQYSGVSGSEKDTEPVLESVGGQSAISSDTEKAESPDSKGSERAPTASATVPERVSGAHTKESGVVRGPETGAGHVVRTTGTEEMDAAKAAWREVEISRAARSKVEASVMTSEGEIHVTGRVGRGGVSIEAAVPASLLGALHSEATSQLKREIQDSGVVLREMNFKAADDNRRNERQEEKEQQDAEQ